MCVPLSCRALAFSNSFSGPFLMETICTIYLFILQPSNRSGAPGRLRPLCHRECWPHFPPFFLFVPYCFFLASLCLFSSPTPLCCTLTWSRFVCFVQLCCRIVSPTMRATTRSLIGAFLMTVFRRLLSIIPPQARALQVPAFPHANVCSVALVPPPRCSGQLFPNAATFSWPVF